MLDDKTIESLCEEALKVRSRAYAPYSKFRVGAALLCKNGEVITGCNVENASYGLCICAERAAVGRAVARGEQDYVAIAIATGSSPPSSPCGMCRQTLAEFTTELPIFLVNTKGERDDTNLSTLFPGSFDSDLLNDGRDSDEKEDKR